MESLVRVKLGKYVLYESVKCGCFLGALYAVSGEHGALLLLGFVLFVFSTVYNSQNYLQNIYKKLTVNSADGIVYWNGRGCDVDVSGFGLWSSVKLTYMEGVNRRTVRIPSTVFSSDMWKQLSKFHT